MSAGGVTYPGGNLRHRRTTPWTAGVLRLRGWLRRNKDAGWKPAVQER